MSSGKSAKLKGYDRAALWIYWSVVLICYIRIYFGVSPLDEAQHVGSAFLTSIGGQPFYTEMYLQQIAGLLYEPVAAVYHKIMGRTGMYLFARHLFFFLTLLCSWIFYRCFRDRVSFPTALVIATLPLFGTVNGWPTINYHTLGSLGFAVSVLMAIRSVEWQSDRWAAGAGFAFFIAVAGYPTLGATAVITWVIIAGVRLVQRKSFWRQFFICAGVATLCMAIFASYLYLRFDPANIVESFYFSKTFNTFGSFTQKILYSAWLFWGFAPSWWIFFPLLATWLVLWKKFDVPLTALGFVLFIVTVFKEPPERGTYIPTFYLLMGFLAVIPLGAKVLSAPAKNWGEGAYLFITLVTSVFICWSSGLTLYSTSMVTNYVFAPFLAVTDATKRKTLQYSGAALILVMLIGIHFKHIPDDDPFFELTEQFTSGPFAGLFTSLEHHQFLTTMQADINECGTKGKSVLFYDHFPAGFLMTEMAPATRSLFMHDLSLSWPVRQMYRAHYENPANRPDCVFRLKRISTLKGVWYNLDPEQFAPAKDVFWYYLPEETGEYRLLRERETYNVYAKKTLF